jgi:hypothetical protein
VKRTERTVTVLWAGIFLALFYANIYERQAPPFVPWDRWEIVEDVRPEVPEASSSRPDKPPAWTAKRTEPPFEGLVGVDTVSAKWLQKVGRWPDWKASRFMELRTAWGGVDSLLAWRESWDRVPWSWVWAPPKPIYLLAVSVDTLYAHPLWRSHQVRAFHRFRSKVRPVRNWEEVYQLADFDSTQRSMLPRYFKINSESE